jgi:hypothetical protein
MVRIIEFSYFNYQILSSLNIWMTRLHAANQPHKDIRRLPLLLSLRPKLSLQATAYNLQLTSSLVGQRGDEA